MKVAVIKQLEEISKEIRRNVIEQVKIDENTYLTNVKKITVNQTHSVALTLDGDVYSWGQNDYGKDY